MLILPAIDLLEGRCVRLHQGRFDRPTVYSDDPVSVARSFVDAGAEALHVVDLEAARLGKARNLEWIYRIRQEIPVFLQIGGGIRTFALASRLISAGIDRVVLGTAAAERPRLIEKLLRRYGAEQTAASLDTRDGRLALRGWETESAHDADEIAAALREMGLRWVVCTDVQRDGTLAGPGLELASALVDQGFAVVVAGGVSSVADVARIRALGAAGCIIGTALYSGALELEDALEAAVAD